MVRERLADLEDEELARRVGATAAGRNPEARDDRAPRRARGGVDGETAALGEVGRPGRAEQAHLVAAVVDPVCYVEEDAGLGVRPVLEDEDAARLLDDKPAAVRRLVQAGHAGEGQVGEDALQAQARERAGRPGWRGSRRGGGRGRRHVSGVVAAAGEEGKANEED